MLTRWFQNHLNVYKYYTLIYNPSYIHIYKVDDFEIFPFFSTPTSTVSLKDGKHGTVVLFFVLV